MGLLLDEYLLFDRVKISMLNLEDSNFKGTRMSPKNCVDVES